MKGILLRLFWDCKKLSIKNYFHTTCETASKLNQSKLVCFFWIWAILNFNRTRLKINSLTFYKMNFHTQNVSKKHFFSLKWGCVPIRARASAKRLPSIQMKKSFLETFWVWNSFILSRGWFQLSMAELLKKCMKFCFVWNLKRL